MSAVEKPTRDEIQAAEGEKVADLIRPGLKVLFCGINPGLYSGAVGHHFAYPGNRFWPALYLGGFTPRQLEAHEGEKLLELGYGITNFVERATARASDLEPEEFVEGKAELQGKIAAYQPDYLAVLGIGAFRKAFGRRKVELGLQPERFGGAKVWLLPNPSGLNAHYQVDDLGQLFAELRAAVEEE